MKLGDDDEVPLPWRGEEWICFEWASERIKEKLGISLGAAQRTLRELCGSGDIRSIRCDAEEEPEFIKPSDWLKGLVDFEACRQGCKPFSASI